MLIGIRQKLVDYFYQEHRSVIDQTTKNDILVVQGDWSATIDKEGQEDWSGTCGPYSIEESSGKGLWILKLAAFNSLVLTNTLACHKPRRQTWHNLDGEHHNQISRKHFQTAANISRTRSLEGQRE